MAVSSITGKKKATTVAKNTGNSSGSQVSSIGSQRTVLRNAPTTSTSRPVSRPSSSASNSGNRNRFAVSSIGSSSNSKKATGQLGGSKPMSFADRIAANNGIAPQETPELPGIEPIPTDNTETLDLAKTYMGGDAEGISSPEDSSWAGVDRETGMTAAEQLAQNQETLRQEELAMADDKANAFAVDQGKLIEDNQKAKKYAQDQEALRVEGQDIQNQSADIQADQQITDTQTQLHNLKQNIGFLGQMGQPGVAAAALDAVDRQLVQAGDVFKNLLKLNSNRKAISSIGEKMNANQFGKQMQDLQDNLDSNVSKLVQDAFNKVIMADGDGKLDTMEEVFALKSEIGNALATSIADVTQGNILKRQQTIDYFTALIEEEKVYVENAQVFNPEKSAATGVYTDMNGNPRIDTKTNAPIPMPIAPPIDPVFDQKLGQLVTFSYDEDGGIVANVQTVKGRQGEAIKQNDWKYNADTGAYFRTGSNGDLEFMGGGGGGDNGLPSNNGPQIKTGEEVIDTGMPSVNGGTVKLTPTVDAMLQQAYGELADQGIELQIADSRRSTETQAAAYESGKAGVAAPGTSFHEIGQAFDLAQTQEMNTEIVFQALRNSGLQQHPDEWWHWSYGEFGSGTESESQFTDSQERQFKNYNGNDIPEEYKSPQQKKNFLANYDAWSQENPNNLNKEERTVVNQKYDDLAQDPSYKAYETVRSKVIGLDQIVQLLDNNEDIAQDKQQLISDFAKALDPTSVVREGEYAIAAKYSQSKLAKIKQEAINWVETGGPISDDAALVLSAGLQRQYDNMATAHDLAIDTKLKSAKSLLQKDITTEALGAEYSHLKMGATPGVQQQPTTQQQPANPNDPLGLLEE